MPVIWGSLFFSDFFRHAAGKFFASFIIRGLDLNTRQGLLNAFLKASINRCCVNETDAEYLEYEQDLKNAIEWILFDTDKEGKKCERLLVNDDFLAVINNAPFYDGKSINFTLLKEFMFDALGVCKFEDSGEAKAVWTGKAFDEGTDAIYGVLTDVFSSYGIAVNMDTNLKLAVQQISKVHFTIEHAPTGWIPFKNGTLEILDPNAPFEEGKAYRFHKPSRDFPVSRAVAVNFNPNAQSDEMDHVFNEWATRLVQNKDGSKTNQIDKDLRAIYEEVIGYVLLMSHDFKGLPLLYGDKNCGKSTYLDLINFIVGQEENKCYPIKLHDLDSKFNTAKLLAPRVYFGDDQSGAEFSEELQAFIKNAVSEGTFQMEEKFQTPFRGIIRGVGIFSANVLPRCSDYTCRMRFLIVPFLHSFKTKAANTKELKKLLKSQKAGEYAALLGVRGAMRMMSRCGSCFADHFTNSRAAKAATEEFNTESNSFLQWIPYEFADHDVPNDQDFTHFLYHRSLGTSQEQEKRTIESFYKKYKDFCNENAIKRPLGIQAFRKALPKYYPDQNITIEYASIGTGRERQKKLFWVIPNNPSYSVNHQSKA